MNPGRRILKSLEELKIHELGRNCVNRFWRFSSFSLIHSKKWKGTVHENGATFKSPTTGELYELTPEKSIDIQMAINSDILVTLDDCRQATLRRDEAETSVSRTIDWAKRCRKHFDEAYGGTKKQEVIKLCCTRS